MPATLSKLLLSTIDQDQVRWSVKYNCYEAGHTWTSCCSEAALDVADSLFFNSLKLYCLLYFGTQLVIKRKYDKQSFIQSVKSALRSSSFLAFIGFAFITGFCVHSKISGRLSYPTVAYIPGLVAGWLSFGLESESRQSALTFYGANLAVESIAKRIAANSQLLSKLKGVDVILFASSLALYMQLTNGLSLKESRSDPIIQCLRFLLNVSSHKSQSNSHQSLAAINGLNGYSNGNSHHHHDQSYAKTKRNGFSNHVVQTPLLNQIQSQQHKLNLSCLFNAVKSGIKPFLIGWLLKCSMASLSQIQKQPSRSIAIIRQQLSTQRNANYGLFLGSMAILYNSTRCVLAYTSNKPNFNFTPKQQAMIGFMSGLSMYFSPSSSLAQYVLWSYIEKRCATDLPSSYRPWILKSIFAASLSHLLHSLFLHPTSIRKAWRSFVFDMSGNYLNMVNKVLLSAISPDAMATFDMDKDSYPQLDLLYTSRHYKETILPWLLF